MFLCYILILISTSIIPAYKARIHNIQIESDRREIIPLATFGLTKNGFIEITMSSLVMNDNQPATYGM